MKTLTKLFGMALLASSLAACGSSTTTPYNAYNPYNGYGNQTGYAGQGGCVPIQNGSFSFSAQGAAMNNYLILAGNLPMNSTHPGQYGQVTLGGSGNMGGGGQMIQYSPVSGASGTIQMTASSGNGQAMISGTIQINPYVIAQYAGMSGMAYNGYNGLNNNQAGSQPCVQSIGFDIVHTIVQNNFNPANYVGGGYAPPPPSAGQINRAVVYLYLNNGTVLPPIALPQ